MIKKTNNKTNTIAKGIVDQVTRAQIKAEAAKRTPLINESVFIGFRTDGDGKRVKGGALDPFDKIVNIYAEKEAQQDGAPIFNVQVSSGDVLKVVNNGKSAWQAIA